MMIARLTPLAVVATGLMLGGGVTASAADLALTGTADGDSRWYDFFSDSFAQLDRTPDGFYLISAETDPFNPAAFQSVGGGADVFPDPDEALFDLGVVSYDDSGLTGTGVETVAITGYTNLDFQKNIADDDALTNSGYGTSLSNVVGTVTFTDGALTGINLTSDIVFTYDFSGFGAGDLTFSGTYSIAGDRFDLLVNNESYPSGFGDIRFVWDSQGVVNQVIPEPASALLLLAGSLGFVRRRRRV